MESEQGILDLIAGPMFSSKTTTLLGRLFAEAAIGKKVLYINHSKDNRSEGDFSTHNPLYKEKPKHKSVEFVVLSSMLKIENPENYDVIGVDEGQFFKDLIQGVIYLVEELDKHVIVAGLNGSHKRDKFGDVLELEPMSDTYTKLTAWCLECAKKKLRVPAPFTHKISGGGNLEEIGGIDKYIPVCRRCYKRLNK